MPSEPIITIIESNARLATLLRQPWAHKPGAGTSNQDLSAVLSHLPEISGIIEKAGAALRALMPIEDLDRESKLNVDLYAKNLQNLKAVLMPILASAQACRESLLRKRADARETLRWLSALKMTEAE